MVFLQNLKKSMQFKNAIFLYNGEINYNSIKNYTILMNHLEKNTVIFDTKNQYMMYNSHQIKTIPDVELIKYFYDNEFEIYFVPWLVKV